MTVPANTVLAQLFVASEIFLLPSLGSASSCPTFSYTRELKFRAILRNYLVQRPGTILDTTSAHNTIMVVGIGNTPRLLLPAIVLCTFKFSTF